MRSFLAFMNSLDFMAAKIPTNKLKKEERINIDDGFGHVLPYLSCHHLNIMIASLSRTSHVCFKSHWKWLWKWNAYENEVELLLMNTVCMLAPENTFYHVMTWCRFDLFTSQLASCFILRSIHIRLRRRRGERYEGATHRWMHSHAVTPNELLVFLSFTNEVYAARNAFHKNDEDDEEE